MALVGNQSLGGHVFISYVREDSVDAARLQRVFEDAGLRVWRENSDLLPGEDKRAVIRKAITEGSLVFVACFSRNSVRHESSYQNQEIGFAVDEVRTRRPGEVWLIPVRFDDCQVPDWELGGGRTLRSIQRADLFGDGCPAEVAKLIDTVRRKLGAHVPQGHAASTDAGTAWENVSAVRRLDSSVVDVVAEGEFPRVSALNPYRLGATSSAYGHGDAYGLRDRYVPRANDQLVARAFLSSRLVVIVGPSKAGKTRTAFEVLRTDPQWGKARLAVPFPDTVRELARHSALATPDPLVIWLDDLHRFLPPSGQLAAPLIDQLADRPGPTLLVATLRSDERERLRATGEMSRDVQMVLNIAAFVDLASTRDDPAEQRRAAGAYPRVSLKNQGLAEVLAGAPDLLYRYRDVAVTDPVMHAIVRVAVECQRCGLNRPISERDLLMLARARLEEDHPGLGLTDAKMADALSRACERIAGGRQVAMLQRHPQYRGRRRQSSGYTPFDYLVAADNGQDGQGTRPIADQVWQVCLARYAKEIRGPEIVLPFFGGSGAGKTRLIVAIAELLRSAEVLKAEFADAIGGLEVRDGEAELATGWLLPKTSAPRALVLQVKSANSTRPLRLSDMAGERFHESSFEELGAMIKARTYVLVINPLAIEHLWLSPRADQQAALKPARTAWEQPDLSFIGMVEQARKIGVRLNKTRLAIVFTHADLLSDSQPRTTDQWVAELGNLIRTARHDFAEVALFRTASVLDDTRTMHPSIANLTAWLLSNERVTLPSHWDKVPPTQLG